VGDVSDPDASAFAFADLAGFTALTEAHGDEAAADLAGEFARSADELLLAYGAERVKMIGDALTLRVPDATLAITLGLALTDDLMAQHGYPAIRVGMHYGPAVQRGGDWFGATVNLAARSSGLAGGGEVLLSEATLTAAGRVDGVHFDDRGSHHVRNVTDPIQVLAATRVGARLARR
jgi:adenylate cyclase